MKQRPILKGVVTKKKGTWHRAPRRSSGQTVVPKRRSSRRERKKIMKMWIKKRRRETRRGEAANIGVVFAVAL